MLDFEINPQKKTTEANLHPEHTAKTFLNLFTLTNCRYGRQLHAVALALQWLWCRVDPGAGVPHCLQPFLLDVLQLDGDRATMTHSFPQLKPHASLLSPSRNSGVNDGALVLSTEVPEAAPAVHGHLHPTVVVVGAAERRRLTAA